MAEWSKATISDFGTTITGKTPSTKNSDYWDGTRMFVTPKDIQSTKHITHTERYISNKGMEAVKGAIIPANSICVSCIGNIGYLGVTTEECITNQQINSIIVSDENSADFVYYYMKYLWPYFKNYEGQSTTLSILNKTQFSKIEVRKPDIDTQIAIASLLSSIDDKIEANEKINNNLEQQAAALFQAWFVNFEPFGGSMPENWTVGNLGQIAELKTRSFSPAKNPDTMLEHYSIPSYDEKHFPVFEVASGVKSNKYILTPSSVMISKLNPDTKRIWRPLCLTSHAVCSTEFMVYEAINPKHRDFVYSIIDDPMFSAFLCAHTTGSTNSRQRATPSVTLTYPVPIPSNDVIDKFCATVSPMYDLIGANTLENQKLAKTRDSLLPKLMSGELDVSGIES